MKRKIALIISVALMAMSLVGCSESASYKDKQATLDIGNKLAESQPTPTDIEYSLERYNLIRREYWVNGMVERANTLECPVEKPLGYIVLIADGVGIVGAYTVDGKVSSLNSFLTPDSMYYSSGSSSVSWLPDVDGSYGENDGGIFFFTVDGHYKEWNGMYLYSDTPMHIDDPMIKVMTEE